MGLKNDGPYARASDILYTDWPRSNTSFLHAICLSAALEPYRRIFLHFSNRSWLSHRSTLEFRRINCQFSQVHPCDIPDIGCLEVQRLSSLQPLSPSDMIEISEHSSRFSSGSWYVAIQFNKAVLCNKTSSSNNGITLQSMEYSHIIKRDTAGSMSSPPSTNPACKSHGNQNE